MGGAICGGLGVVALLENIHYWVGFEISMPLDTPSSLRGLLACGLDAGTPLLPQLPGRLLTAMLPGQDELLVPWNPRRGDLTSLSCLGNVATSQDQTS